MQLDISFRNPEQEIFYWSKARNNRFGGGFGNGKTYVAMQRALTMMLTFSNYRVAICRQTYKRLRASTMQTFLKICPKSLILQHDEQFGLTVLFNDSRIYWLHLDQMDEATAKGFEINSLVIDQVEEVEENVYLLMDARVGRWDQAKVPDKLLKEFPEWPRHKKWGYPLVPNYVDLLDNPSNDDLHWVSRYFDDDSEERKDPKEYFSIVRKTDDDLNDEKTIKQMLTRDQAWVDQYYWGKKVISGARIHRIPEACKIYPAKLTDEEFENLLKLIRTKASLYRILDHGETAPTCCGWGAHLGKSHIIFGEYYVPDEVISVHRQHIYDLSVTLTGESNLLNYNDYADPQIFKRTSQKNGGFWSTADEYADEEEIEAPPIYWGPADNNELATRNRINELLKESPKFHHPITNISPAPGLYFLMADEKWPYGCHQIVAQTNKQKKQLLGEINGKKYYSDKRDDSVVDHAYDVLRYYVAIHGVGMAAEEKKPPKRSFAYFNRIFKARQQQIMQG